MYKSILKNLLWFSLFSFIFSAGSSATESIASENLGLVVYGKRLDAGEVYLINKAADTAYIVDIPIQDSLPNIISDQKGFTVDYMGIGQKKNLTLRGYSTKPGVVVYVDGVKQNDLNNDWVLWESIPLDNIEKIEIVRGGSSVIYGAGAVGGVINITTKKSLGKKVSYSFEKGDYNSSKFSLAFSLDLSAWNIVPYIYSSKIQSDGYRDNSKYDSNSLQLSVLYGNPDKFGIEYIYKNGGGKSYFPGPLTKTEFDSDPTKAASGYDKGEFYDEKSFENLAKINTKTYFGDAQILVFQRNRCQISNNDQNWFWATSNIKTQGVALHLENKVSILGKDNLFIWGYEGNKGVVDYVTASNPVAKLDVNSNSFFISDQLFLDDLVVVDAGYRFDDVDYSYKDIYLYWSGSSVYGTGERAFEGHSPALGVTFFPYSDFSLYMNANKSFKVMPMEDFAVFSPSYNANPDVNPQVATTYEFGANWKMLDNLNLKTNFYKSFIKDEILYNDKGYKNENLNTEHEGFSLETSWQVLSDLACDVSYVKDITTVKSNSALNDSIQKGDSVPNIPDSIIKLDIGYSYDDQGELKFTFTRIGEHYPLNDFKKVSTKIDAYTLLNANWSHSYGEVTVFARAENITNVKYPAYSVYGVLSGNQHYYSGNGQSVYLGIKGGL